MIRKPPVNPFKDEQEADCGDVELPELPDRVVTTVANRGNGSAPASPPAASQEAEEEESRLELEEKEKQDQEEAVELERMREEQENAKIPGSGYLFNVKPKHLPEATRLNEREIFTFGVGNVQDEVLNLNRTKSVYELFRDSIFRLKISLGGKGRDENISVRQVDAEEKANAARGSLNGI